MTWQEKFAAIQALSGEFNACLRMRKPDDWYVADLSINIGRGNLLHGVLGNGTTPQEAIENCWTELMNASNNYEPIVKNAYTDNRKEYKWSGYMWTEI